jgi:ribose 5-phosphate isomerase B
VFLVLLAQKLGWNDLIKANKFKGVRSAPCFCTRAAQFSRLHNDSNVLSLGADYVTVDEAKEILNTWLDTEFEGGRHQERLDLVADIESENMK